MNLPVDEVQGVLLIPERGLREQETYIIYRYMPIHIHMCVYIYIYIERYMYTYIYI